MPTPYQSKIYKIAPVAKPRMTQRDKWAKRPAVLKYFQFKDDLKKADIVLSQEKINVTFRVRMPDSWSKKKKELMRGQPHQQRPDIDNFAKGLLDAVIEEDSTVWCLTAKKLWDDEGSIEIH